MQEGPGADESHTGVRLLRGALLAKIEAGVTKYYHQDHLSNRVITDAGGNKIGESGHYPFGENWYESGGINKLKFTTYERDGESGNDYALARYHINRLGRFSSPDLIAGSSGDPQSLNRYAYVRNDPSDFADPLGLVVATGYNQTNSCLLDNFWVPMVLCEMMYGSAGGSRHPIQVGGDELPGGPAVSYTPVIPPPPPNYKEWKDCQALRRQYAARFDFAGANQAAASDLAATLDTSDTFVLGHSSLESGDGSSHIARNHGNYFGLTVGPQFRGTQGPPHVTSDGRQFGTYPSPGFLNSGMSFAQSTHGGRVRGAMTPQDYARGLTTGTPQLAPFNSEPGYVNSLVARIDSIAQIQNCLRLGF
jgi:RHS repeat-associated protein